MKRGLGLLVAFWAGLGGVAAWAQDVALIIANDRYETLPRLSAIADEQKTVTQAYKDAGFEVMLHRNTGRNQMWTALARFEDKIEGADRLVIHFMGHILPTPHNLRVSSTEQLDERIAHKAFRGIGVDVLYEVLSVRPGRSMLVLATPMEDVRDHIARGPRIGQGTLVVAGETLATNRLVSQAILRGAAPGDLVGDFEEIVRDSHVSFRPFVDQTQVVMPATKDDDLKLNFEAFEEMEDWRNATNSGTAAGIEAYIAKYPQGLFANEARARLEAMVPAEQRAEAAMNLTRADRRRIQEQLTLLGYNTRGVDGIFGRGSRRAIERFQADERFKVSGFLDVTQLRVLESAARERQVEVDRANEEAKRQRDAADLASWRRFQSSRTISDLQAYLTEFPEGLFADQARRTLEEAQQERAASGNAQAAQVEAALGLNSRTRRMVEQRLAGLRINPGPVDGTFDNQTRQAIAQFQKQSGLQQTGYLTNETVGQLIASVFR